MSTRVFAFLIGIDNYKSGRVWNLESCVDDAKRMKRWLTHDLGVPRDQICMLLDSKATKRAIEDNFMNHLTNNLAIERGDAMLIYFAGHGSTVEAPQGWFEKGRGDVDVLCPYDHDSMGLEGRIAGISDRSLQALLFELCAAKGNNVTLILDCCFSPPKSATNVRDRSHTRWTPTIKARPDDLFSGLWVGARGKEHKKGHGLLEVHATTHTLLAASRRNGKATEGKEGGRFTNALLHVKDTVSLHRTSYSRLIDHLLPLMGEGQLPICLGENRHSAVLGAVPFVRDSRFIAMEADDNQTLRIQLGAIHGIVEGSELSAHIHNYRGSHNPSIATVFILEVYPTWSVGRCRSEGKFVPERCWGKITRWNNRTPFRVYLKKSICSIFSGWKFRRQYPAAADQQNRPEKNGLNILRVKHARHADISLSVGHRSLSVERHDQLIAANCRRAIRLDNYPGIQSVVENAARFQLHLYRRNPENPLRDLVTMELFQLDPLTWSKIGDNLLQEGIAKIAYEKNALFTVVMQNHSDIDLWPFLAYMDPSRYCVTMIYDPDSSLGSPPLQKQSHLEIGTGEPGSEALSFNLADHEHMDSGFLKLFVSSTFTPMGVIEQGVPSPTSEPPIPSRDSEDFLQDQSEHLSSLWDTSLACITLIRV